jgi:glycosyltransferase involved in cell wall biosynthesis
VIEALYCGKPVISSNIGEVAEMLTIEGSDEKAGVLVDWRDPDLFVANLANAMNAFVADRALIARYSSLAPRAFAKFDMDNCARQYIHLYEQVCSS